MNGKEAEAVFSGTALLWGQAKAPESLPYRSGQ